MGICLIDHDSTWRFFIENNSSLPRFPSWVLKVAVRLTLYSEVEAREKEDSSLSLGQQWCEEVGGWRDCFWPVAEFSPSKKVWVEKVTKTVSSASSSPDNTATVKTALPALSLTRRNEGIKPITTEMDEDSRNVWYQKSCSIRYHWCSVLWFKVSGLMYS